VSDTIVRQRRLRIYPPVSVDVDNIRAADHGNHNEAHIRLLANSHAGVGTTKDENLFLFQVLDRSRTGFARVQ